VREGGRGKEGGPGREGGPSFSLSKRESERGEKKKRENNESTTHQRVRERRRDREWNQRPAVDGVF
jgi:hypothetical protein